MSRVYVSIGSNIDRERNVRSAVATLRERHAPLTISPVYETEAVGFEGDAFYNLVVGFHTSEPPETLTEEFHAIEAEHGRRRGSGKFASRTLDIDLLTWGAAVFETPALTLPRKEILEHAFVLGPLADIAPEERHPVVRRTYAELWAEFDPRARAMTVVPMELA